MASGIEIDDAGWFADMKAIISDDKHDAIENVRQRAERTVASARRYAPRAKVHDPSEPVLADNIRVEQQGKEGDMPYFDAGTEVPHGFYQEFGTSKMAAHPWWRPAVEENLD